MLEYEACAIAAEMLITAGFEHRTTSMQSEATYYGLPERLSVIRVACHKAHRSELNGIPVAATITFNRNNFRVHKSGTEQIPRDHIIKLVCEGIGKYILVTSGAIRGRVRLRDYHEGYEEEVRSLTEKAF